LEQTQNVFYCAPPAAAQPQPRAKIAARKQKTHEPVVGAGRASSCGSVP